MLYGKIEKLLSYGINVGLLAEADKIYARNQLLDLFHEENYAPPEMDEKSFELEVILEQLLDEACSRGIIEDTQTDRDLFDTKLMNCIMPRPSQVQHEFWERYRQSPEAATEYYYEFCQNSDYIRRYRIAKDKKWKVESDYGDIDITINLSKPEKDPKAIAAAGQQHSDTYPKCLLCKENEGYAGRINHPGRMNHRIIPVQLNGREWGFQYSPYVYYNEHCIVLNEAHVPMKIAHDTFVQLFDFVKMFPHYFLGSNADLPIVGGSILSHDHYQGGHYTFAMERASYVQKFVVPGFEDVEAGIIKWPLSVIRLEAQDEKRIIELADRILEKWRGYTDETVGIYAETDGEAHNTITPIARRSNGRFQLDLALRNNRTSEEYPLGIFHPHPEYHNIKKENIGLIEVMGLAVLPARLDREMEQLKHLLQKGEDYHKDDLTAKHAAWVDSFMGKYENVQEQEIEKLLRTEIGHTFVKVLEDTGVFKNTEEGRDAFIRFIHTL